MKQPVHVRIQGLSWDEEGREDSITTISEGDYLQKEEKHHLIYKEYLEGVEAPVSNRMEISRDAVRCIKKGPIQVDFLFLPGETTKGEYATPLGSYSYELYTKELLLHKEEDKLFVSLEYLLTFPPAEGQLRKLLIEVKERKEPSEKHM